MVIILRYVYKLYLAKVVVITACVFELKVLRHFFSSSKIYQVHRCIRGYFAIILVIKTKHISRKQ